MRFFLVCGRRSALPFALHTDFCRVVPRSCEAQRPADGCNFTTRLCPNTTQRSKHCAVLRPAAATAAVRREGGLPGPQGGFDSRGRDLAHAEARSTEAAGSTAREMQAECRRMALATIEQVSTSSRHIVFGETGFT